MCHPREAAKTIISVVLKVSCTGLLSACSIITTGSTHANKTFDESTYSYQANHSKTFLSTKQKPLSIKPLFGVDIQIAFSIQVGSYWTSQKIKFSAIHPGSAGALHGEDTLSIPITGGKLSYQTSPPTASGTIVASGGFMLSKENNFGEIIRNIKFDIAKHVVLASVNNTADQELFELRGIHNLSIIPSKQITLRSINLFAPRHENKALKNYFRPKQLIGVATITISITQSNLVNQHKQQLGRFPGTQPK